MGHDVYLFAPGDSLTSAKLVPIVPHSIGQGVVFHGAHEANRQAYLKAVRLNPDVIWDHSMASHAHVIKKVSISDYIFKPTIKIDPRKLVDTGTIPVIHTLHGPAKNFLPGLMMSLEKAGHYFVAISNDQRRRYLRFLSKTKILGTVWNAIDLEQYKPPLKKKRDHYVWVGRFGMEKGAHIALEVAHLALTPLKIVGKLAEEHERKYFDSFIKPFLKKDDEVLINASAKKKIEVMGDAKATLMTNIWPEPFGLVSIESMAVGTPVVAPSYGSLTEIVADAGVLVPVTDLRLNEMEKTFSLKQKMYARRITNYLPLIDSLKSVDIRQRAETYFSPKENALQYIALFRDAIELKATQRTKTFTPLSLAPSVFNQEIPKFKRRKPLS
jgi:glycosyltransferase involved in cell wall biosynthesis